jgi:hypothetical protein
MNIGYNKRTQELIGYSDPINGKSILVKAYAVDDLEKKFQKELKKLQLEEDYVKNHTKAIEYLYEQDAGETQLMVDSINAIIKKRKKV